MGHTKPIFLFIYVYSTVISTVNSKKVCYENLPVIVFESRISGIGSNPYANWATTTAQAIIFLAGQVLAATKNEFVNMSHLGHKCVYIRHVGTNYALDCVAVNFANQFLSPFKEHFLLLLSGIIIVIPVTSLAGLASTKQEKMLLFQTSQTVILFPYFAVTVLCNNTEDPGPLYRHLQWNWTIKSSMYPSL